MTHQEVRATVTHLARSAAAALMMTALLLGVGEQALGQAAGSGDTAPAMTMQAIDHWNLRYLDDEPFTLEEQAVQLRRNMDVAAEMGFSSYLIFAREEVFESLLRYDFEVEGVGHVGRAAGVEPNERLRRLVAEVIEYGKAKGLEVFFHTNQLYFPDEVLEVLGPVEPPTERVWQTYRKKMEEFFRLFPDIAGLQITGDETMVNLTRLEDINRLTNETADAAGPGRTVLMRTWQRIDALEDPSRMFDGIRDNVVMSLKNTRGDFKHIHGFDERYAGAADPARQVVEFDAWREYENHNIFPFYLGDYWAPRFRELHRRGVRDVAVRFNWNSGRFALTERPWANLVNLHLFVGLARDPYADPDSLLRTFIAQHYPEEARVAAFDLYKHSTTYVHRLYYTDEEEEIADHGRVNRLGRTREQLDEAWLERVNTAYEEVSSFVDALPEGTPYKGALKKDALLLSFVSKGIAIASGAKGDMGFKEVWERLDPASYAEMRGENVPDPTTVSFYPTTPGAQIEERFSATVEGVPVPLELQATTHPSKPHSMESARVRLAADGPLRVELEANGVDIEAAYLRTVGRDLDVRQDDRRLSFELPGPGHYYLQLPELTRQAGTSNQGTYTLLFWVDDRSEMEGRRVDPAWPSVTDVTRRGVTSDPGLDQTEAMQEILDEAGTVYLPAGVYRSGSLRIPSGTTLYLAPGALLKGTDHYHLTNPGAFLAIEDAADVVITGPGTIDANGMVAYGQVGGDESKVRALNVWRSRNVALRDVLVRNSNSWAVHIYETDGFHADNVKVFSGKDGFDPDASRDVLIENAFVQSYDDALAVKTRSRNPGQITERVVMRNSIVSSIKSALKIGTETRARIRDVTIENVDVFDGERGIVLYARDGGPVENVTWRGIRLFMIDWPDEGNSGRAFHLLIERRDGETPVRDVLIENVSTNALFDSEVAGLAGAPLDGVTIRDLEIRVNEPKAGKPYLFTCGEHVRLPIEGLTIDWQGHEGRWAGVASGDCLHVLPESIREHP